MSLDTSSGSWPSLDPVAWNNLLSAHALKNDMFSVRTLSVIYEGIDKLAQARAGGGIVVTGMHATLFERLQRAFNNPSLLKDAGTAYLEEFGMPAIALKHFELAHQFAPKDREIEELQVAAALAVARAKTNPAAHSGLNETAPSKPEVGALLRTTSKLSHVVEKRADLGETAGELGQKERKTSLVQQPAGAAAVDFNAMLKHATRLVAQNDFAAAAEALARAREAGAPSQDLQACYGQLGLAAYDQGRMDVALGAFEPMRDLAPEAVEGWFNCGLVYQKLGRLDQALASYQEATRLAPDNPKTWCNLSSVWFERGEAAVAEKAARRALELKHDYARAWDNLAAALSAQDRLTDAAEACRQATRIQPGLHSAWFKFGMINFQLDDMFLAAEAFNVIPEDSEFYGYVLYYHSMIAARRGDVDEARLRLVDARGADPDNQLEPAAIKELALAFTKAGQHLDAAGFYRQIIEKHPDDFSSWLALGTAHHRAEQFDRAREAYLHATELRSASPVPWHNLGLLASDQGNHEEARNCFQSEVELAPEDAKAWYDLGVSLRTLGLEDEAAEAFEKAEGLVKSLERRSSDLSAALSIVRRLNLSGRMLKTE